MHLKRWTTKSAKSAKYTEANYNFFMFGVNVLFQLWLPSGQWATLATMRKGTGWLLVGYL